MDVAETKRMVRNRIEIGAEEYFEKERINGFTVGALDFGDTISELVPMQKEELRIRSIHDLSNIRDAICKEWGKLIDRTALFQVGIDFTIKITFIVSILFLFLHWHKISIVFILISLILYAITIIPGMFPLVMYYVCGSFIISDHLLILYHQYGRVEASIYFADYRNFSHINEKENTWVFTTSHKTTSSV